MNMLANGKAKGSDRLRSSFVRHLIVCVTLMTLTLTIKPAIAAPEDEVRATFDRFVLAQNAHDIKAVESLLLGSPNFLWITRGTPVWGHDAALKRFGALYDGTWRLDPEFFSLENHHDRRRGGANLRPNPLHNWGRRSAAATNQVLDEPSTGQDIRRLASVKRPAYTSTGAMT